VSRVGPRNLTKEGRSIGASGSVVRRLFVASGLDQAWAALFAARDPSLSAEAGPRADGRWSSRYESLDLWRALIAIGIVLHHAGHVNFGINTGRVVLFFVISGYCIVASAESCLRRGMSGWEFFARRARRIYPPYLLALLFWAGTRAVKMYRGGENDLIYRFDGMPRSAWDWVYNVTLTQWLPIVSCPVGRPGDNPALFVAAYWSLAYEEQFYIVVSLMFGIALVAPWARMRWMVAVLVPGAIAYGLLFPQTIRGLFIEFWVAFAVGAAVYYRLSVLTERRWRRAIDVLLVGLVLFGLAGLRFDERIGDEIDRSKWHEWILAGTFALLLIGLRRFDARIAGMVVMAPLRAIGRITYSMFLIHQFNLVLIATMSSRLIRAVDPGYVASATAAGGSHFPWYDMVLQLFLHIVLAAIFWVFCEYPFLNKALSSERPAVSGAEPAGTEPMAVQSGHVPPAAVASRGE